MKKELKKVLVLGSGALKIGQAGEFDCTESLTRRRHPLGTYQP